MAEHSYRPNKAPLVRRVASSMNDTQAGSREQSQERTAAIRTNAAKRNPVRGRTTDTQHRDTAQQPRSANYSPPTPRWDQIALMRTYYYRLYSHVL
jgi:hypothetical protein